MSKAPDEIHPRLEDADVVIVDQEDVSDIWPLLDHSRQRMFSEDEYTKGKLEFNLIIGPENDWLDQIEEPGIVTQLGYNSLKGDSVLDLRERRGGFGDALFGLAPSRDEESENHEE